MHSVTSNAVARANSYSMTEHFTGRYWINGKPIYRKVIDFGALPNSTAKTVAHNLSNVIFTKMYGIAFNSSGTLADFYYPLPYSSCAGTDNARNIELAVNGTYVEVDTKVNRSYLDKTYIILEYTKTTD